MLGISLLIATAFSIGFFIESIVGFGGGLIAYFILGFFIDLKTMIMAGLYIGTCSSFYIAITDIKNFDKKIFLKSMPIALIGTIIGVYAFSNLSESFLSITFATILLLLSLKIIAFDNYELPKIFKNQLILIGGISQGAFGIGGPFWVNALKNDFLNKSQLRTTMAIFFVFFNLIRFINLAINKQLKLELFSNILWVIIPVFISIKLGHLLHLRISESFFKKLIGLVTMFAGLKFGLKIFL